MEDLLSDNVDPGYTQETQKGFEIVLRAETLPAWTERNRDKTRCEKPVRLPKAVGSKLAARATWLQMCADCRKKEEQLRPVPHGCGHYVVICMLCMLVLLQLCFSETLP